MLLQKTLLLKSHLEIERNMGIRDSMGIICHNYSTRSSRGIVLTWPQNFFLYKGLFVWKQKFLSNLVKNPFIDFSEWFLNKSVGYLILSITGLTHWQREWLASWRARTYLSSANASKGLSWYHLPFSLAPSCLSQIQVKAVKIRVWATGEQE